jgi:acyl carrier protein
MVIDATLAAYLEAFIAQHNLSDENRWTYLNWTSWQGDAEQNALATTAPTHGRELRSNILQYLSFDMEHILISDQLPAYAVMLEQHKNAVQGLLPAAEQAATQVQAKRLSHYIAPTNQVEQQIVDIWQQLLGVETVSTHDNFFELGGHSLLGTQLVTRLRDTFHITLPLRTLFEQATVAELALIVIQQQAEHVESADIEELLAELENLSEQELQDMLSE